jgi:hypothetical protein
MGFIWKPGPQGWCAVPLDDTALPIAADDPGGAVLLLRSRGPAGEEWFLLAVSSGGVEVNGVPLYTGIRALRDRDHLSVAGVGEMFFTSERLAQITAFPGSVEPMYCPRDRRVLLPNEPCVQCPAPACAAYHHAACWSYCDTCALCEQPTALDAGFRWTPGDLDEGFDAWPSPPAGTHAG